MSCIEIRTNVIEPESTNIDTFLSNQDFWTNAFGMVYVHVNCPMRCYIINDNTWYREENNSNEEVLLITQTVVGIMLILANLACVIIIRKV